MLSVMALSLLLALALLAIPLTLHFEISYRQHLHGQITLQWLFGLLRIRLPIFPGGSGSSHETNVPRRPVARKPQGNNGRVNLLALLTHRPMRRRLLRFLSDVWHTVHKKDLRVCVRLGLDEPGAIGQLWAMVGPVAGMLANAKEVSVEIEPEFTEAVVELDSSGTFRLIPLQLFSLVIALLFSPAVWQGILKLHYR